MLQIRSYGRLWRPITPDLQHSARVTPNPQRWRIELDGQDCSSGQSAKFGNPSLPAATHDEHGMARIRRLEFTRMRH